MRDFERNLEIVIEEGAHPDFRVFVSSEPPPIGGDQDIIPESILQNSVKVANEAPQDLKSNIRRCFSKFDDDHFEKANGHKLRVQGSSLRPLHVPLLDCGSQEVRLPRLVP